MQISMVSIKNIHIRKRSVPEWLVFFLLITPFTFGLLIDMAGLPTIVRFSLDFALVGLIIIWFTKFNNRLKRTLIPLFVYFFVFSFYLLTTYLATYQSIFYFIWGYRNNFRFIFVLFMFVTFMDYDDAEHYLKVFDVLFWANFVVCLVQYYGFGYKQDYLGGFFGTSKGCNAYLNVFLCIITTKSLIYFLNKKEKIGVLISKLAISILISALAELKFYYVELIIILCVVALITKFTWKKVLVIALSLVGVAIGSAILVRVFPEYVGQLSLELLYESATSEKGYTSSGDINRLSAIGTITKLFFNRGYHFFIGYGLGNCDLSNISIFNTPFYESHGDVHYKWFSHAFMYLETGYIGLMLFFGIFVLLFICARKSLKEGYADLTHCQLAMTISLLCLILIVYNSTLRSDAVYMISFVLALPFIKKVSVQDSTPLS